MSDIVYTVFVGLLVFIFLSIPSIIVYLRNKSNKRTVLGFNALLILLFFSAALYFMLNRLYPWPRFIYRNVDGLMTPLLWLILFIWSLLPDRSKQPNTTDELDKLFALKQKGAITEDEYETRKQQLLKS